MVISIRCIIEPIAIYCTAELLGLIELTHAMRIVHADIKPDNFLIGGNDQTKNTVYIIDFGLSINFKEIEKIIRYKAQAYLICSV